MLNKLLPAITLLFFLVSAPLVTVATPMPSTALGEIHQRLLKDPSSLDLLYEYAQAAIDEGNFEAAIGALEGMLVIASDQPRVLLELGVLYKRLGVFRTANHYLRLAKQLSPPDSKVAHLADEYLTESNREESPHVLTGFVRVGLRYQSNPTFAPETYEILSNGYMVPLPETREPNSDINAALATHVVHRYDFTNTINISSDVTLYATAYNDRDELDFGMIEFLTGPQFTSSFTANGQYSIRPHLILRASGLDSNLYEQTVGAGFDFHTTFGIASVFSARYQYRDVEYEDYNDHGTAPLHSGDDHSLGVRYGNEIFRGHLLEFGLFGATRSTDRDYFDVDQYKASLRYSVKFYNFLLQNQRKMSLTPYIIRRWIDYGAADPEIDPGVTRSDKQWRFGLNYLLPLTKSWSIIVDINRLETSSNIVNYDVTNNMGTVSLQMGF